MSLATAIALGRNANGWRKWRNIAGKTLDKVKREDV